MSQRISQAVAFGSVAVVSGEKSEDFGSNMTDERFSKRHGYTPQDAEISIRDDAPYEVRAAILKIAEGELRLSPSILRDVLCTVLRKVPDRNNWSDPNIWGECQDLIESAPWYSVYDFVEALFKQLVESNHPELAQKWTDLINEYFVEVGVGWRLVNGQLESRGTEVFEVSVESARGALDSSGLRTARNEIHEALRDLSRRPEPDLTGAVQHGMAALECTAREIVGDPKATLGDILKRHPDLLPKPLDVALSKMWGYASEFGRHVREGRSPERAEAELVVGVAAAVCTYLVSRHRGG